VVEAAQATGADLIWLAAVYFALGERLDLDWLRSRLADQGTDTHWVILAKAAARDELSNQQKRLALAILEDVGAARSPEVAIESWLRHHARLLGLYEETLAQLHGAPAVDLAMASVAVEGLRTLLFAAQPAGGGG
jgi:glutamate dehydrogenase